MPAGPRSRREVEKTETRRALVKVALDLFAAHGYDAVTTDAIAEGAGVSPRTFFRYFPTKESVLLGGQHGWYESFLQIYPNQPATSSDLDAICLTFVALAPDLTRRRRSLLLYERAVTSSATLRGRVREYQTKDRDLMANVIAARRGLDCADESCRLLASIGRHAFRSALHNWLAGPSNADLGAAIAQQFRILREAFVEGVAAS